MSVPTSPLARVLRGHLFGRARRSAAPKLQGDGGGHIEAAELGRELILFEGGASRSPVLGGEFEESRSRPVRQDADDVAQVALGVEVVEPGGRDERQDVPRALGVGIAAREERRVADTHDLAQSILGQVVVESQSAVVEEGSQRTGLPNGVAECATQRAALVLDQGVLAACKSEKLVDEWSQMRLPERLDLRWRVSLSESGVELENLADPYQCRSRDGLLRERRFPVFAPRVGPTSDRRSQEEEEVM